MDTAGLTGITPRLDAVAWAMIAAYPIGMLAAGAYYSRRNRNAEDYLVGGRRMRPSAVGLSFFVAVFSTITYLSVPGEMIRHGPVLLAGVLALPFVFVIAGWGLIPVFMRLDATSGYELLEARLGVSVRMLGLGMFLALRLLWMSVIVYATVDTVIVPLTGLSPAAAPWVSALLTGLTIVYTTMGGLRAIVAVDAVQALLLFAGVVASLGLITVHLGGIAAWWPSGWTEGWSGPDGAIAAAEGRSVLGAFTAVLVWHVCTAGSDQMAIQRYLATRDVAAARRMLGVALIAAGAIQILLAGLGLALGAYAAQTGTLVPPGQTVRDAADQIFPRFIVSALPSWLAGLLVAGLLAEATNSLSSGISATSAVITTDLIGRWRRVPATSRQALRTARWTSLGVGAAVVVLSVGVGFVHGNLLEVAYKVVNLLVAPLFGLFFMAIFVRAATPFGTCVGAAAGVLTAAVINYWTEISGGQAPPIGFFWAMPLSLCVQILVGLLASLAGPASSRVSGAAAGP